MKHNVHGIHHITAITGDPQKNVNFYAGVLGLRMVKRTVNFDDPLTYHFYFGDNAGQPGTILTFFPWSSAGLKGRVGIGQLTATAFSIPEGSMGYWMERLKRERVPLTGPMKRFDEEVLALRDPDGIELELVASAADKRPGSGSDIVADRHSIRGIYGATLSVEGYERTAGVMTVSLGCVHQQDSGNRFRYTLGKGEPGGIVDLLCLPSGVPGRMGVGAVHHVAWRIASDHAQMALRNELVRFGFNITPVLDRKYFRSVYFREPGGILFEVATDGPGFSIDESADTLGSRLMLPDWLESRRSEIVAALPPIIVRDRVHEHV